LANVVREKIMKKKERRKEKMLENGEKEEKIKRKLTLIGENTYSTCKGAKLNRNKVRE
jgi:hypothetical protein